MAPLNLLVEVLPSASARVAYCVNSRPGASIPLLSIAIVSPSAGMAPESGDGAAALPPPQEPVNPPARRWRPPDLPEPMVAASDGEADRADHRPLRPSHRLI